MEELFSLKNGDRVSELAVEQRARPALLFAVMLHLGLLIFVLGYGFGPPAVGLVLHRPSVAAQYDSIHLVYYSSGRGAGGGGGGGGKRDPKAPAKAAVPGPPASALPLRASETPQVRPPEPEPPAHTEGVPITLPSGGQETIGVPDPTAHQPPGAGSGQVGGIGTGTGPGIGEGSGPGVGPGSGGGVGGGPFRPGGGVSMPRLIHEEKVKFPDQARRNFTTGIVILEAVVKSDGTVGGVRVIRSLPDGCVEASIEALRKWRFLPGRKDGVPVDVYFMVTFTFS